MNARELKTIRDAADRFMEGSSILTSKLDPNHVVIRLPLYNCDNEPFDIYVEKNSGSKKFHIIYYLARPKDSSALLTFVTEDIKEVIENYGLLVSNGMISERDTNIPLHKRIGLVAQTVIGIDGMRRLARAALKRRTNVEGKTTESLGNSANNS
jgi:hypothetical protein